MTRGLVLAIVVACSSPEPRVRPDSEYKFAFTVLPSGNEVALQV